MLVVRHPDTRLQERRYTLDVLFRDFLGLEYVLCPSSETYTVISVESDQLSNKLVVDDVLLQIPDAEWLSRLSLPSQPLDSWRVSLDLPEARVTAPEIPIIYGRAAEGKRIFEESDEGISLSLDVFGSAFFMLTRYEEVVKDDRDEHDRFPAAASLAYQEGFLNRPIIDEYVEVLWACIKRLWPGVDRKKREYRLMLSHDVDHPLAGFGRSWPQVVRSSVGDLVKRKEIALALSRLRARLGSTSRHFEKDPYNTFDFLMHTSEKKGLASAFYFITAGSDELDRYYPIEMPWITGLLRRIHSRGHEIGLHGSYGSYVDGVQMRSEFERLLETSGGLGIEQAQWGNRQHYVRWRSPVTWRLLDRAGISYDTTLSFADHIGFRCGVCNEYTPYDIQNREMLSLRERPLIAMDVSLTGAQYMHLREEGVLAALQAASERSRVVKGAFTLLWHNSTLATSGARRLYEDIIDACVP